MMLRVVGDVFGWGWGWEEVRGEEDIRHPSIDGHDAVAGDDSPALLRGLRGRRKAGHERERVRAPLQDEPSRPDGGRRLRQVGPGIG